MKRPRHAISVTPRTYARIVAEAAQSGSTQAGVVEDIVNRALDAEIARLAAKHEWPLCEAEAWLAGTGGAL